MNWEEKDLIPRLAILISIIELLPKWFVSCSFSEVILVLFSIFNDVAWF